LSDHPHIQLIFIGGRVLKSAQVTIGVDVVKSLADIRADYCILGTRSIHSEVGITEIDWEETKVKQSFVQNARELISLVISEKLETTHPYFVTDIKSVSIMITELEKDNPKLLPYVKQGIEIL
jgi:DeoR/GlpR family transcriptional regulator of sugar metabolism